MRAKEKLKVFIFKAVNIFIAFLLLFIFFISGKNIAQTFEVARISALNNLLPQPFNYLWKINIQKTPVDKNRIHCYTDYYEHLIRSFPSLRDAYGILGYCYHYLGDDTKAIDFLKKAIDTSPYNSWNYYNLGAIYLNESQYRQALILFTQAQEIPPQYTLRKIFNSRWVYLPLIEEGGDGALRTTVEHLTTFRKANLALIQVLSQQQNNKEMQGMLKNFKMDLYAF